VEHEGRMVKAQPEKLNLWLDLASSLFRSQRTLPIFLPKGSGGLRGSKGSRLCQTMRMADRREFLQIETYVCGIPASAVCRRCEVKFVVARSLAVTPQKAVEQFYAEFDSHKCHPRETEREAIRADAA